MQQPAPRQYRTSYALAALGCVLLAAGLRCYHLEFQNLWMDEAFSARIIARDPLLPLLLRDSNPPGYYLALKLWTGWFGDRPATLRGLSVLFGVASVALLLSLGPRLWGRAGALAAAAFFAISPYMIYYAQEARAYSLLTLCLLACALAAMRARTPGPALKEWLLFSAAAATALHAHYLAGVALATLVLWVGVAAWRTRDWRYLRALMFATAAAAAAFLPWGLAVLLAPIGASADTGWIAEIWRATPPAMAIPLSLQTLLLGGEAGASPLFMKQFSSLPFGPGLSIPAMAAFAVLFGLALRSRFGRGERPGNATANDLPGLLAAILAPLAVLWLVSLLRPLYVVGRYDVLAFPFLTLLVGALAGALVRRGLPLPRVTLLAAGVLTALIAVKLVRYYGAANHPNGFDEAERAGLLAAGLQSGDGLLVQGGEGLTTLYYLHRNGWDCAGRCSGPAGASVAYQLLALDATSVNFDLVHAGRSRPSARALHTDISALVAGARERGADLWVLDGARRTAGALAVDRMIRKRIDENGGFEPAPPPAWRRLGIRRFTFARER